jgi:chromosome segregation ATPase
MFKIMVQVSAVNRTPEEREQEKNKFMSEYSTQISKYKLYNKLTGIYNTYSSGEYKDTNFDSNYLAKGTSDKYMDSLKERFTNENNIKKIKDNPAYSSDLTSIEGKVFRDIKELDSKKGIELVQQIADLQSLLEKQVEDKVKAEEAVSVIDVEINKMKSKKGANVITDEFKQTKKALEEQKARQETVGHNIQTQIEEIKSKIAYLDKESFTRVDKELEGNTEKKTEYDELERRISEEITYIDNFERLINDLKAKELEEKDAKYQLTLQINPLATLLTHKEKTKTFASADEKKELTSKYHELKAEYDAHNEDYKSAISDIKYNESRKMISENKVKAYEKKKAVLLTHMAPDDEYAASIEKLKKTISDMAINKYAFGEKKTASEVYAMIKSKRGAGAGAGAGTGAGAGAGSGAGSPRTYKDAARGTPKTRGK